MFLYDLKNERRLIDGLPFITFGCLNSSLGLLGICRFVEFTTLDVDVVCKRLVDIVVSVEDTVIGMSGDKFTTEDIDRTVIADIYGIESRTGNYLISGITEKVRNFVSRWK